MGAVQPRGAFCILYFVHVMFAAVGWEKRARMVCALVCGVCVCVCVCECGCLGLRNGPSDTLLYVCHSSSGAFDPPYNGTHTCV